MLGAVAEVGLLEAEVMVSCVDALRLLGVAVADAEDVLAATTST
jgi:hypothetical protein